MNYLQSRVVNVKSYVSTSVFKQYSIWYFMFVTVLLKLVSNAPVPSWSWGFWWSGVWDLSCSILCLRLRFLCFLYSLRPCVHMSCIAFPFLLDFAFCGLFKYTKLPKVFTLSRICRITSGWKNVDSGVWNPTKSKIRTSQEKSRVQCQLFYWTCKFIY